MPKPESPIGESHPVPEQSSELPTNQERIPAIVESAQERTDAVTAVRTRLEQHAEQNEAGNHETSADAEHHGIRSKI